MRSIYVIKYGKVVDHHLLVRNWFILVSPTGFGWLGFSVAEFIVLCRVLGMKFLGLCLVPILAFTVFALKFDMAIYHGWFLRGG